MSYLNYSKLDSDRFNLRIFRSILDSAAPVIMEHIVDEMVQEAADITILRIPSQQINCAHLIQTMRLPLIHADSLVYYTMELRTANPAPLRNPLTFTRATAAELPLLSALVLEIFTAYTSHYSASPDLDPALTLRGYQEWATHHIRDTADKITWIAWRDETAVGFASCSFDESGEVAEGVLYGVHPEHSGGGVYGDLIRHTQAYFKANNFKTMKVSTQVNNLAVQKVWTREGFYIGQALDTFHINTLISCGDDASLTTRDFAALPSLTELVEALSKELPAHHITPDSLSWRSFASDPSRPASLRASLIPHRAGHTLVACLRQGDALASLLHINASRKM
jgi:GNAT superfamily N-acetyltransferase